MVAVGVLQNIETNMCELRSAKRLSHIESYLRHPFPFQAVWCARCPSERGWCQIPEQLAMVYVVEEESHSSNQCGPSWLIPRVHSLENQNRSVASNVQRFFCEAVLLCIGHKPGCFDNFAFQRHDSKIFLSSLRTTTRNPPAIPLRWGCLLSVHESLWVGCRIGLPLRSVPPTKFCLSTGSVLQFVWWLLNHISQYAFNPTNPGVETSKMCGKYNWCKTISRCYPTQCSLRWPGWLFFANLC